MKCTPYVIHWRGKMQRHPHPRAPISFSPTFVLVVINIAVYIYTSFTGGSFIYTADNVLKTYGQFNYAVLRHGWWWQLFTSMFVHVHLAHITSNIVFLLIFGWRTEEIFSDSEFYVIYFMSGLAGNLLSLLWPLLTVSAGASGAIFGLFGSVLIYLRKLVGRSIIEALFFALMFFVITVSAGTNVLAHLGGLLIGLGIGYGLAETRESL